jgi:hypothetical protein
MPQVYGFLSGDESRCYPAALDASAPAAAPVSDTEAADAGRALDRMMTGQGPTHPPVARPVSFERTLAQFVDLRQLSRAIIHLTAQHSCRTALHGFLGRRIY